MMARKFASRADELRHHRKAFELGLELGITPKDAEALMEQVEARERHRARCRKLGHESALPALRLPTTSAEFDRFDCPWMARS